MRIRLHRFGCLHDAGLPAEVNFNQWNVGVAFLGEHAGTRLYQSERRNFLLIDVV